MHHVRGESSADESCTRDGYLPLVRGKHHRARHKTTARNGLGSSQGMNDMRGSRRRTHLVHALMSQEVV